MSKISVLKDIMDNHEYPQDFNSYEFPDFISQPGAASARLNWTGGIPKSPWVSMLRWVYGLDDFGCHHFGRHPVSEILSMLPFVEIEDIPTAILVQCTRTPNDETQNSCLPCYPHNKDPTRLVPCGTINGLCIKYINSTDTCAEECRPCMCGRSTVCVCEGMDF